MNPAENFFGVLWREYKKLTKVILQMMIMKQTLENVFNIPLNLAKYIDISLTFKKIRV